METYNFTVEEQQVLDSINTKFEEAFSEKAHLDIPEAALHYWDYLKQCEGYYLDNSFQTEEYSHDMENILSLYTLNDLIDKGHLTAKLRDFHLPKSEITAAQLSREENLFGKVHGDGTIYAISKFCQLDPLWMAVLCYYFYYKVFPEKKHPFVNPALPLENVTVPNIPQTAKVAIIGDWGTGKWRDGKKHECPSELVIQGVIDEKPDFIIHLGDVYYAGTKREERKHLLDRLPESYKGKVFTMNSNHEMYDGANGLLGTTLKDPRFTHQGGSSCFAIEIGNWVIVALDSAYYDDSFLYMDGSLKNKEGGEGQLKFLSAYAKKGKKLMLLTHHNGILVKSKPERNSNLWNEVVSAIGNKLPDAWYWGHVHNGIVYNGNLDIYKGYETLNGGEPIMRCCGHASIPFGNGTYLGPLHKGDNSELKYYAHTPMPDPTTEVQKLRVLNGFALIEITGSELTETFYEVSNTTGPVKAWPTPG
jgi:hypothetical protein